MKRIQERVWIRVAGNAKAIKEGRKDAWRCFIGGSPDNPPVNGEILLRKWTLSGMAIPGKNFIPGFHDFNGSSSGIPVVVAWIDIFGNITIEDGTAHITLLAR